MLRPRIFKTGNLERCQNRDSSRPGNLKVVKTETGRDCQKVVETETLSRVSLITEPPIITNQGLLQNVDKNSEEENHSVLPKQHGGQPSLTPPIPDSTGSPDSSNISGTSSKEVNLDTSMDADLAKPAISSASIVTKFGENMEFERT